MEFKENFTDVFIDFFKNRQYRAYVFACMAIGFIGYIFWLFAYALTPQVYICGGFY